MPTQGCNLQITRVKRLKRNRVYLERPVFLVSVDLGSVFASAQIYVATYNTNSFALTAIWANTQSSVSEEQITLGVAENV